MNKRVTLVITLGLLSAGAVFWWVNRPQAVLARLSQARSIRVFEVDSGLGVGSRTEYALRRTEQGFAGSATFSSYNGTGVGSEHITNRFEVRLPLEAAQTFFETLAQSPLRVGSYQPQISHTDDYPDIEIEIDLGNEAVRFFSKSQGESHVPWGATVRGIPYTIKADAPARALAVLKRNTKPVQTATPNPGMKDDR